MKSGGGCIVLKKGGGLEKGSCNGVRKKVGRLTRGELEEIGKSKEADLSGGDLDGGVRSIGGCGG